MGFYADHCVFLPPMLGWFAFSALLSAYNKVVFGEHHMNFPCPLLLTSVHFSVQWTFSYVLTTLFSETLGGSTVKNMTWKDFLSASVPCGLVTSGDVGFSNLALVRITITFYTMVKASTPIFVLAWAFAFGIERITLTLIVIVTVIAAGEFLTVLGEAEFDLLGFLLCCSASVLSGARWTLVQLKLSKIDPPLKTALATMRVLSPSMFASMLVVSFALEKPWEKLGHGTPYFATVEDGFKTVAIGLGGAFLAIAMMLCEFFLIMKTNAIVLMIGGVIKEMVTIFIGVAFFKDSLNGINFAGCMVVFLGVVMYKISLHLAKLEKEAEGVAAGFDVSEGDDEEERTKRKLGRVLYRSVTGTSQSGTFEQNGNGHAENGAVRMPGSWNAIDGLRAADDQELADDDASDDAENGVGRTEDRTIV